MNTHTHTHTYTVTMRDVCGVWEGTELCLLALYLLRSNTVWVCMCSQMCVSVSPTVLTYGFLRYDAGWAKSSASVRNEAEGSSKFHREDKIFETGWNKNLMFEYFKGYVILSVLVAISVRFTSITNNYFQLPRSVSDAIPARVNY